MKASKAIGKWLYVKHTFIKHEYRYIELLNKEWMATQTHAKDNLVPFVKGPDHWKESVAQVALFKINLMLGTM